MTSSARCASTRPPPTCRMRFLRAQLDDPGALDCGRCDNCGGLTLTGEIGDETVSAAASVLGRPGVPFDSRRMWPSAMPGLGIEVRGKVAATDQAETGRVIARLTDLGFGSRLRPLLAAEAADAPVPDDLVKASVQVLASWDWAQRPAAVVRVGSVRRPRLIADLASRLAELGRLTDLGQVTHVRPSSTGRTNSALRLREVWNAYEMPRALAAAADRAASASRRRLHRHRLDVHRSSPAAAPSRRRPGLPVRTRARRMTWGHTAHTVPPVRCLGLRKGRPDRLRHGSASSPRSPTTPGRRSGGRSHRWRINRRSDKTIDELAVHQSDRARLDQLPRARGSPGIRRRTSRLRRVILEHVHIRQQPEQEHQTSGSLSHPSGGHDHTGDRPGGPQREGRSQ